MARGGRWERASALLDTAGTPRPEERISLALAAAQVALERDWFGGTSTAGERLRIAEKATQESGDGSRWDLDFLWLRHDYLDQLRVGGAGLSLGPAGKDPDALAGLRSRAVELRDRAPDDLRGGWAEMYLGLISDNLFGERDTAPRHYELALRAGESGDDLLAREALRHLGDHDHDSGDHERALARWRRATALGARAGAVTGTLSQQMLLAEKDVDGVTLSSYSAMSFGLPGFRSCTPGGILRLLDEYDVDPAGKRAVVVGRSAILGKPVGMLLLGRDATVTYCHSVTADLSAVVREADIVVAAVGRPRLIHGEDIKPGAVVVDAGYNPGNVGDVDFDTAVTRAGLITPVPGGVGPMTIATLLEQTVEAAARQLAV